MEGKEVVVSYFHAFGSKCFVHNNGKTHLKTFDERADEGVFLGYSSTSKAFRVFNKRRLVVEESIHVMLDDKHVEKTSGDPSNINVQNVENCEKSEACLTPD